MTNTLRPPSKVTVVEEGTEFQGTLTSSCPIDVRGRHLQHARPVHPVRRPGDQVRAAALERR